MYNSFHHTSHASIDTCSRGDCSSFSGGAREHRSVANIARGGQNIARARLMSRRTWRTSRETPSVRQPPRPLRSNGVVWTVAVANSPALTVQSWTGALGESGGAGEQSATPIAQQLSSTTSFHVVPADCSGRRWLHQSIIIFACAASRCLESAVIVYRSHLRRSGTVNLRFKMIIFKSCPIGPDRLHTACSCALCRARCFELRLSFVTVEQSCQADRVWQLRSTAFGHDCCSCSAAGIAPMCPLPPSSPPSRRVILMNPYPYPPYHLSQSICHP